MNMPIGIFKKVKGWFFKSSAPILTSPKKEDFSEVFSTHIPLRDTFSKGPNVLTFSENLATYLGT